jgi:hypothetical protein
MNSLYDTIASKICASLPSVLACGMSVGDLPYPTPTIYTVSIYSARHSTAYLGRIHHEPGFNPGCFVSTLLVAARIYTRH